MPVVRRSIEIAAPVEATFELSNRLADWPEIMEDYSAVEVLREEAGRLWFRLTHANGSSWISWRLLHRDGPFALAERLDPIEPFRFMQHAWLYAPAGPGRTEMTWLMNFELPEGQQERERDACQYLAGHAARNQARMKAYVERMHHAPDSESR